jgi:hypothetical protein
MARRSAGAPGIARKSAVVNKATVRRAPEAPVVTSGVSDRAGGATVVEVWLTGRPVEEQAASEKQRAMSDRATRAVIPRIMPAGNHFERAGRNQLARAE